MNFYDYIKNDIEEKKALIEVLPHNTEIRKKKFLEILNDNKETYLTHKKNVENFLMYKNEKLSPSKPDKNTLELDKRLNELKDILKLGNPYTSYFERLGLDSLFFDLTHYFNFSLNKVNELLEKILLIVESSGLKVNDELFKTNVYSYSYMHNFMLIYYKKETKPNSDSFESIYWLCPKVIEYIIIDLWILIRRNVKKFDKLVSKLFNEKISINEFKSYEDVYNSYINLLYEKEKLLDEDEYDIVNMFINGELDINSFLKESDLRTADYEFFLINKIDLNNAKELTDFYKSIINLRYNFFEYSSYIAETPLINFYKEKYKLAIENSDDKKKEKESLKQIEKETKEKNKEIDTLYKNLLKYKSKYSFGSITMQKIITSRTKEELFEQESILENINKAYNDYFDFYYDCVCNKTLKFNSSVSEIYRLVFFYPYFNRKIVKEAFKYEEEEDIDNTLLDIEKYLYNPHKKIIDMVPIYVDKNIAQQLTNGFRFENLNINTDSFEEENRGTILDRSLKVIRCMKLDVFSITPDEIILLINYRKLNDEGLI